MKELSIEQKAKRYDEALEKARTWKDKSGMPKNKQGILDDIFPELAESEDEKIRKALIKYYSFDKDGGSHALDDITPKQIVAWLEKQGEQKPTIDKVEPKFKVSDWITDGYLHCKITDVLDDRYIVDTKFAKRSAILFDYESRYHLWTIQDAKDGDVLADEPIEGYSSSFVAIYKKQNGEDFDSYCFVGFDGKFYKGENGHSTEDIHPATKEQRELLFQKMKEAGYEWDAEKKDLKKIEQKPIEDVDLPEFESHLCLMFQKFRTKGICTNGEIIDYVKEHSQKLKDILAKPAWSENDSPYYDDISEILINLLHSETTNINKNTIKKDLDWFISLKPKNTWKPSDEQIWALSALANFSESASDACKKTAKELLEQLKKLREE